MFKLTLKVLIVFLFVILSSSMLYARGHGHGGHSGYRGYHGSYYGGPRMYYTPYYGGYYNYYGPGFWYPGYWSQICDPFGCRPYWVPGYYR